MLSHVDDFIRTVVNVGSLGSSNDGMDAFLLDFRPGEKIFFAAANFTVFMRLGRVSQNLKVTKQTLVTVSKLVKHCHPTRRFR